MPGNILELLTLLKITNPVEHSGNTLEQTGARHGNEEYRKFVLTKISLLTFCNVKVEKIS